MEEWAMTSAGVIGVYLYEEQAIIQGTAWYFVWTKIIPKEEIAQALNSTSDVYYDEMIDEYNIMVRSPKIEENLQEIGIDPEDIFKER